MESSKLLVNGGGVVPAAGSDVIRDADTQDYGGLRALDCPDILRQTADDATPTAAGPASGMRTDCSLLELRQLMTFRGAQVVDRIREDYGGIDGLCRCLHTDTETGLPADDVTELERRRDVFGANSIPAKSSKMFVYFIWEAVQDVTLIILILAAIASLCVSFYQPPDDLDNSGDPTESRAGYIESIGIMLAVFIIVLVTAFINWSKDVQFRGLQRQLDKQFHCIVLRAGKVKQLSVEDLVVGDVCLVKYGDVVPADGLLIKSSELRVDESSHTGESKDVRKTVDTDPALYAGTDVVEGCGKMVVTAVGVNSARGIIFSLLGVTYNDEAEPEEKRSVLHQKLVRIALNITYAGTSLAVLTFVILVIRFCVETFVENKKPWSPVYVQDFLSYLIISITLLAVAVPEGLPLAVVLALAYSIRKMMDDNNLVRHLDACETMGNATTICCDKTGTLTTNRMTVVHSYIAGRLCVTSRDLRALSDDVIDLLASSISINSSYASRPQVITNGGGTCGGLVGNKTELALLTFVGVLERDLDVYRRDYPESCFRKLYTFNSDRKWMGTVVPLHSRAGFGPGEAFRLHVKGASEIVLAKCEFVVGQDGGVKALSDDDRRALRDDVIEPMAGQGFRTIAVAYRDFVRGASAANHEQSFSSNEPDWSLENDVVCRLVCIAIVGIEDPVRPEVPVAIKRCQEAGITVRMVTGDNINTARFIAVRCGILTPGDDALTLEGRQFNDMIRPKPGAPVDQSLMDEVWPRLRVLARSSPEDKHVLVKGIMDSRVGADREIVAVTGDGTNDGPALKKAHVGLAMGISGTDVAKEASDIILLDDNFASIVKAVVWGRHVYDSIAKFLQFQLTVNVVAVTLALLGACVIMDSPLKGIQMLWVNLLMDTLASLSLATERPTDDLLKRKPYGYSQHLVSATMLRNILCHAAYELIVLIALLFSGEQLIGADSGREPAYRGLPTVHYTFVFNSFVMMILFNEICARKLDGTPNVFSGLHNSPLFVLIWLMSFVVQVLIVEFGGDVFFTVGLTADQWLWCIFFGISDLVFGQLVSGTVCAVQYFRQSRPPPTKDAMTSSTGDDLNDSTSLHEMHGFADNKPFYTS